MSEIELADVRALIETGLTDPELQKVVNREEDWLAGKIGPLAGERTDRYYIYGLDRPLLLRRPAASVEVSDDGVALDPSVVLLLANGYRVELTTGAWDGPVDVTWEPIDTLAVEAVTIDLVRLRLSASGYTAEQHGTYSYTKGDLARDEAIRQSLVDGLLKRGPRAGSAYSIVTPTPWIPRRVSQVNP